MCEVDQDSTGRWRDLHHGPGRDGTSPPCRACGLSTRNPFSMLVPRAKTRWRHSAQWSALPGCRTAKWWWPTWAVARCATSHPVGSLSAPSAGGVVGRVSFQVVDRMLHCGDSLFVMDQQANHWSVFSVAGKFERTFSMTTIRIESNGGPRPASGGGDNPYKIQCNGTGQFVRSRLGEQRRSTTGCLSDPRPFLAVACGRNNRGRTRELP